MKRKNAFKTFGLVSIVLALMVFMNEAKADGTEQLGDPSIDIAPGSYILVEGVGLLDSQPGEISIEIPAGVGVEQVLLYWSGRSNGADHGTNDTIQVNSTAVTGPRIGGPTSPYPSDTYRADISDMDWVMAGETNILSVEGLDFTRQNDGAAVVVIVNDGSAADIQIQDGNDFAYEPRSNQTEWVEFDVASSADARTGTVWLIVGDLQVFRPAAVELVVGGVTNLLDDVLQDNEGNYMDVVELPVPVPPGVTDVAVRLLSINDGTGTQPASLAWNFVSWVIPVPHTECGGGGLTPGFWQNKHGLGLIDEYGALAELNELCLRDDDGEHADFGTLQQFRAWIKARRAKNMAYQLSGHLAAMYMNVLIGSVNEDALVYIGHQGDMISINNLLSAANEALCEDGYTPSPAEAPEDDENRDYQEMLKNALDKANNNRNWVYPCTHTCHD